MENYKDQLREITEDLAPEELQQILGELIPETITIKKKEYDNLVERDEFLNCLEACGVDNWCGWDDAWEMMQPEED